MGMGNGERHNGRAIMRDLQRRMQAEGIPRDRAVKKAREVVIRGDRKMNGQAPIPIVGQGKNRK